MDILEKIKQPENRKFEIKRTLPSKSEWLKVIVSFANGAGGELILGVDDKSRKAVGIEDIFELEEKISNTIHDSIRPGISPYIQSINVENKQVLSIQILSGPQKPYYLASKGIEKGTYVRIGSTNRQADLSTIFELKRQASGMSYLDQIYFAGSEDSASKDALVAFFTKHLDIKAPVRDHFLNYLLLKKNNGDIFPTFLGIILFGREDAFGLNEFDYSHIKVARYKGMDRREILSSQIFEPPLGLKIDKIIEYTLGELPMTQRLEGATRKQAPLLPAFAVREAIINAIVHRDYSLRGSSVQVDIFDDRLEIVSPGVLPGNLSIELLGQGISEIRNRSLVRIFRHAGFMEEFGSGIARMIQEMDMAGKPNPEFLEKGAFFCVTLRMKPQLAVDLQEIYQLCRSKGQLSSSEVAKQINIHQNTAIKKLQSLVKLGLIETIGSGKNTGYRAKIFG
ncbi:MAG: ATP-binding protein [bacterium]|nr:ATP-binding protein [bacterium]